MFDTSVTIVGTVGKMFRYRTKDAVEVVSFRVNSVARRFDKEHNTWVDGESLWVKVKCWRQLCENVSVSVFAGDPIIATGRLVTRQYEIEGKTRFSYELDAQSVGLDLSRGVAQFQRNQRVGSTDVTDPDVEDSEFIPLTEEERELDAFVRGTLGDSPDADRAAVLEGTPIPVS